MVDNPPSPAIEELKRREREPVILAHYYTLPEVQAVADFLGDSLARCRSKRRTVEARIDPLRRRALHGRDRQGALSRQEGADATVPEAGCSLADGVRGRGVPPLPRPATPAIRSFRTSIRRSEIKAQTDVCCTSSNALEGRRVDFRPNSRSSSHPTAIWAPTSQKLTGTRQHGAVGRRLPRARGVFARKAARIARGAPWGRGRRASRMPRLYHGGSRFRRFDGSDPRLLRPQRRPGVHRRDRSGHPRGDAAPLSPQTTLFRRLPTTIRAAATTAST